VSILPSNYDNVTMSQLASALAQAGPEEYARVTSYLRNRYGISIPLIYTQVQLRDEFSELVLQGRMARFITVQTASVGNQGVMEIGVTSGSNKAVLIKRITASNQGGAAQEFTLAWDVTNGFLTAGTPPSNGIRLSNAAVAQTGSGTFPTYTFTAVSVKAGVLATPLPGGRNKEHAVMVPAAGTGVFEVAGGWLKVLLDAPGSAQPAILAVISSVANTAAEFTVELAEVDLNYFGG